MPGRLDTQSLRWYNWEQLNQTVEAEVTAMMPFQRVRDAAIRARNTLSNGPLRVQSKAMAEYSATCGHTSVAGDMFVSRKGHGTAVNARWHRG